MKISRILLSYLAFVLVLMIPPSLLMNDHRANWLVPHFWILFFYISLLTLLLIIGVLTVQRVNAEYYAQAFLAGTVLKMLGCLFFIVIFLHKIPVDKLTFAGDFFYIYFFNTVFEVYGLLRNLRNQNLR